MYQRASNEQLMTGAGPLGKLKLEDDGREGKLPYKITEQTVYKEELDSAFAAWFTAQGRIFIVRVTLAFLYATGVLAFLGFLSTLGSDSAAGDSDADRKKRYVCALSVVVNLVAVAHYKMICKIRNFDFGGSHKGEVFAGLKWTAFTPHNDSVAIGVEMAVDAVRHSDWAITLIFLIYKLYYLAGLEPDGITPKTGSIFEAPGTAAGCAVLMVVLSAVVRVGMDEFWDIRKNWIGGIFAVILFAGSVLIMGLILADIDQAVNLNKGIINVELYKSFYLVWIGYPIVAFFSIAVRIFYSFTKKGYSGEIPQWLSMVKDLCYCFLDSWSKGVFAMWTAYTAFHVHLLNAPPAASLN